MRLFSRAEPNHKESRITRHWHERAVAAERKLGSQVALREREQLIGRLVKDLSMSRVGVAAPADERGGPTETPPRGSLVVEITHRLRARQEWPEPGSVGRVEAIEYENPRRPSPYNAVVVLRRMDTGELARWENAMFCFYDPPTKR